MGCGASSVGGRNREPQDRLRAPLSLHEPEVFLGRALPPPTLSSEQDLATSHREETSVVPSSNGPHGGSNEQQHTGTTSASVGTSASLHQVMLLSSLRTSPGSSAYVAGDGCASPIPLAVAEPSVKNGGSAKPAAVDNPMAPFTTSASSAWSAPLPVTHQHAAANAPHRHIVHATGSPPIAFGWLRNQQQQQRQPPHARRRSAGNVSSPGSAMGGVPLGPAFDNDSGDSLSSPFVPPRSGTARTSQTSPVAVHPVGDGESLTSSSATHQSILSGALHCDGNFRDLFRPPAQHPFGNVPPTVSFFTHASPLRDDVSPRTAPEGSSDRLEEQRAAVPQCCSPPDLRAASSAFRRDARMSDEDEEPDTQERVNYIEDTAHQRRTSSQLHGQLSGEPNNKASGNFAFASKDQELPEDSVPYSDVQKKPCVDAVSARGSIVVRTSGGHQEEMLSNAVILGGRADKGESCEAWKGEQQRSPLARTTSTTTKPLPPAVVFPSSPYRPLEFVRQGSSCLPHQRSTDSHSLVSDALFAHTTVSPEQPVTPSGK